MAHAYSSKDGVYSDGSSLYIAGTRDALDVVSWPTLLVTGRLTQRYVAAAPLAAGHTRFVGHSLGGAVAVDLAHDFGGTSVTYGSPLYGDSNHGNAFDPVALLGAVVSGSIPQEVRLHSGHGLDAYA